MKLIVEINGERRSLNRIIKAIIIAVMMAISFVEIGNGFDAEFNVQQSEAHSGLTIDDVSR